MPVTKTAKRALRSSKRKNAVNTNIFTQIDIALRVAKKDKSKDSITKAVKLTDRAVKKRVIHKNKAAHIKSTLSSLVAKQKTAQPQAKKTQRKKH